mmetsp:Transcript_31302/g.52858  ORF Transcript_31302/g.52858 Transcript_31302/m.52858 type:complete len:285 (+) Transcript_31302:1633-2487(+)
MTRMSTVVWPSAAVEKTSEAAAGRVVFRGMIFVMMPPNVSSPSESGVTSRSTMSFTDPLKTPPCTAAPRATTSSTFTDWSGALLVSFSTNSFTEGIRVEPPTNTTSSRSLMLIPASFNAFSTGPLHRSIRLAVSWSNLARVRDCWMCLGPVLSDVMKGREISAVGVWDSSCLAFSDASVSRCRACLSCRRSMPSAALKSAANHSTMVLSKSSPPKCVSPLVDSTSKTPSPTSRMLTSKVPPPKSKTRIVASSFLSSPYARDAAVGSLIIRSTSKPAIRPASLVA